MGIKYLQHVVCTLFELSTVLFCNCFYLVAEHPTLAHLEYLVAKGGRVLKIVTEVAGRWEKMARSLNFTEGEIEIIQRNHPGDVESACSDVFKRWLERKHRHPVTWQTVVECLREVDLNVVAKDLNATLVD